MVICTFPDVRKCVLNSFPTHCIELTTVAYWWLVILMLILLTLQGQRGINYSVERSFHFVSCDGAYASDTRLNQISLPIYDKEWFLADPRLLQRLLFHFGRSSVFLAKSNNRESLIEPTCLIWNIWCIFSWSYSLVSHVGVFPLLNKWRPINGFRLSPVCIKIEHPFVLALGDLTSSSSNPSVPTRVPLEFFYYQ